MAGGSFTRRTARIQRGEACFLATLNSPHVTRLMPEPARAIVSPRGYLLFGRQGTLFAQRFDLESNRLAGDPVSIGSGLDSWVRSPTLMSGATHSSGPTALSSTCVDSHGSTEMGASSTKSAKSRRYRPDRPCTRWTKALWRQRMIPESACSVFLIEPTRNIHARLTIGQREYDPVWSPDSREIAFVLRRWFVQADNRSKRGDEATPFTSLGASKIGLTTDVS